eukprot:5067386-Lingulodinium_polyedra.AAC.1
MRGTSARRASQALHSSGAIASHRRPLHWRATARRISRLLAEKPCWLAPRKVCTAQRRRAAAHRYAWTSAVPGGSLWR